MIKISSDISRKPLKFKTKMKRGLLFAVVISLATVLRAQDTDTGVTTIPSPPPPTAAQIAEKQAGDERYARISADIQALQAANEDLQNKITGLQEEIRKMRDDQSHQPDHPASTDDVKHLADKIEEVDKKREEDKAAITEEVRNSIAGLEKALGTGGSPPPVHVPTPKQAVNDTPAPGAENGFVYTVQSGDSLGAIVHAYNTDFKSKGMKTITLKQTREANPNVDWNKLRVGQKIVIPRPAE